MTDTSPHDLPNLNPYFKLWLEHQGVYVFGPGAFALMTSIHKTGSITKAAKELKMSYRYAWGVIRKIEKKLDAKLLDSFKGGKEGGGGATVTEYGLSLMKLYSLVNERFIDFIGDV
ncbi:MAG: LysR family transcriptional regulator [Candidatus Thorarchaeota archaeon]|nr:LysR family transcriptional regulator [Candidatus Thorarchaeota archaeon]